MNQGLLFRLCWERNVRRDGSFQGTGGFLGLDAPISQDMVSVLTILITPVTTNRRLPGSFHAVSRFVLGPRGRTDPMIQYSDPT
jgi:hypothetical protein